MAVVATVAVAVVMGVVPVPAGVTPVGFATPEACAATAAGASMTVAVAVDPGSVAGMSGGPETICVTVPAGATGADVLAARARALGRPMPRYASSGLLCAIDGQPATGCGERIDGTYQYWAYFLGSGSWTYAGTGPALRRASAELVEGWRYVAGAGNATDPPPRASAAASAICPPPPPPTTATPAPPLPSPAPNVPAVNAPAPNEPAPVSAGGFPSVDPSAPTRPPGPDRRDATRAVEDPDALPGDDGVDTEAAGGVAAGASGSSTPPDPGTELAAVGVAETSTSGGSSWGVFAVVALVVALSAGALQQVRRRAGQ